MTTPRETTLVHTRLSRCALEVEDSRAFWARADEATSVSAQQAFDEYWFGARSLARVEVLLVQHAGPLQCLPCGARRPARLAAHAAGDAPGHLPLAPAAQRPPLPALHGHLPGGAPRWGPPEVTRDLVAAWVGQHGPGHWTMTMRIQFASKLLSAAYSAGVVTSNRDPRPVRDAARAGRGS